MELIINWAVNMIQLPDGGTNPDQKQLYLSNKLFSPVHRREKLQCGRTRTEAAANFVKHSFLIVCL
jgi:hypothetical protein